MQAAVVAAIVTSTVTPVLTGFAAWLGSRPGVNVAREAQRWDTVRFCSVKVHDKDDVFGAQLAFNQLNGLLDDKNLTAEQRTQARLAVRSYLARRLTE